MCFYSVFKKVMVIPITNHDWTSLAFLTQHAFGGNELTERVSGISQDGRHEEWGKVFFKKLYLILSMWVVCSLIPTNYL